MSALRLPKVIPALRDVARWEILRDLPGDCVFMLGGTINSIAEPAARLGRLGWRVFIHVDMLKGLSSDPEGIAFLADYVGPFGIITTHSQTVQHARRVGLATIQRMFLLDSQSLATGIMQVKTAQPDAVETLPGILPAVIQQVVRAVARPVIAGGLITEPGQVQAALQAGAASVSTSAPALWSLYGPQAKM